MAEAEEEEEVRLVEGAVAGGMMMRRRRGGTSFEFSQRSMKEGRSRGGKVKVTIYRCTEHKHAHAALTFNSVSSSTFIPFDSIAALSLQQRCAEPQEGRAERGPTKSGDEEVDTPAHSTYTLLYSLLFSISLTSRDGGLAAR